MEKSDGSDSGSAMKVNVVYRGTVYRVRGVKVLCSVVAAVVMLLVAIVGLGIWMLVSAYAEDKAWPSSSSNDTMPRNAEEEQRQEPMPLEVDFGAPSSVPAPDPSFGLFGGLLEVGDRGSSFLTPDEGEEGEEGDEGEEAGDEGDGAVNPSLARAVAVPPPPPPPPSGDYRDFGTRDDVYDAGGRPDPAAEALPGYPLQGGLPDNIPRDIDPVLLEMGLPFPHPPSLPEGPAKGPRRPASTRRHQGVPSRGPALLLQQYGSLGGFEGVALPHAPEGLRSPQGSYFEDMMYYYNEHERKATPAPPSVPREGQYSQRKGLTEEEEEEEEGYSGPPVVGYGERIRTDGRRPADPVFRHFWDVYGHDGGAPAEHDDRGPVPEDLPPEEPPSGGRPRGPGGPPGLGLRGPRPGGGGPRPGGGGYPPPLRPDAGGPPEGPAAGSGRPAALNHRPFLGPLYDVYEYSRRLASALLSFPGGQSSEASRAEHMQEEVELLEDYNRVFREPGRAGEGLLPDAPEGGPGRNERPMLPDSERLRSLSPFEISLVTWTFLDFWEFLIEKVGTLTEEDLRLLEERLGRLRRDQDRLMAQSLVATASGPAEGRATDPLGALGPSDRVGFMRFAVRVLFNFGRVYLKRPYALDCVMLLFCKDLDASAAKEGMDGLSAKVKSVGLKVLTEREDRQIDTMGEIWRSLTAWETLQCDVMFPKCDGPKALEIVNEVALGSRK